MFVFAVTGASSGRCTSTGLFFFFAAEKGPRKTRKNGSEEGYHTCHDRDKSPTPNFDNGHRVHVARINWNSQVFAHNKLWAERFPRKICSEYAGRKSRIEFSCYWKEVCVQAATDFRFWFWRGCSHHRKCAWADLMFSHCWIVYCAFCQHFTSIKRTQTAADNQEKSFRPNNLGQTRK